MNKRVKIVATLGPAVEIRGGKKFGEDGYWGEKLDRSWCECFPFQLLTW